MSVFRSRLSVLTFAALILAVTVASAQTHRAVDNRVWITGDGGYVEAIEKTTHTATTLASGLPNTFGVAVDRDFVWMTSPGSGRSLLKVDKTTQSVVATIDLGIVNATPRGIAIDPDFVWVADQFIGAVSVVDKRSHAVLRTIFVGSDPIGIAVDDRYAWVATAGANAVARISKLDFSVTIIAVGSLPQGIAVDRHSVWVANAGSNDVSRIDKATGAVIATIPVGTTPRSVAVDGSFAWVLSQSTNTVEKISKASNTVLTTIPAGPSAGSGGNPGISIDASFVWVANGAAGTITQLSKRNGALIASTSVNHLAVMHGDATGYSFDSFWPLSAPADASRDFTDTDNPNGAWTYGWTPRRGETPFTLFTAHVDRAPGVTGWGISFTDELVVTHNTNAAATSERTIVHRPEVIDLHPGSTGENSVVRWTAFEAGVYVFRGYFEGADVVGTTTDVSVLQNSSASLFESTINGYQNRKPFSVTVAALAGETVDFSVGYGGNGSYFFDTTSLAVSVERVTDAVAAFSATRNPNAPWQYGWTPTRGGSFFEVYGVAVAKLPAVAGWGRTATDEMVATHNTGTTSVQERTVVHKTDLIDLHPGPDGERGVLRWTAPSAGAYRVNGRIEGIDLAGTTTDVALLRNGIVLRDMPISGFGDARVFDVQVGLEPGDTIDLSVGYGANATYFNDSTGVGMAVTPIVAPLDVTPPQLTLPGPLSAAAVTAAGAVVPFQISAVDDVDPAPVAGCQPSSGTVFAVGRTVVTCQAMDGSGNIASGTFDVVVTDTAPVLEFVPADLVLEATSPSGAKAEWTAPTATDAVDGRIVLACVPVSGTILPLGEHVVNCSGSDSAANSVSTSFTVRVVDTQFPQVAILSPTVDSALRGSHAGIVVRALDASGVRRVLVNGIATTRSVLSDGEWTALVPLASASQTLLFGSVPVDLKFTAVVEDMAGHLSQQTLFVDNDDIDAAVDTQATHGNLFSGPADGRVSETGTPGSRNVTLIGTPIGPKIRVTTVLPGGVETYTCIGSAGSTLEKVVRLDKPGETAWLSCAGSTLTVTAAVAVPEIEVWKQVSEIRYSTTCWPDASGTTSCGPQPYQYVYWYRIALIQGQTISTGSPVLASADNTSPVPVSLFEVREDGEMFEVGQFVLDPGEQAEVVISPGQVEGEEVITLQALEGHVEGVVAGQPVSIEEGQTRSAINDRTPPTIQLQKPSAATYLVGEAVAVAYICADAASFVVSCTGSAPNGVALDTRAPGVYTFEIVAVDTAGNQSSKTVQYTVSYGVRLLYDPTKIVKSGSTLPIKLQIVDAQGNNRSSSVLALQAVGVQMISSQVAGEVEDAGNANPDWTFRYNADTEGFIYNLKTTGLLTGTYDLRFSIIADPQLHRAKFQVR